MRSQSVGRDVRSGIKSGVFYATLLSLYATGLVLLTKGRVLEKYGQDVTLPKVLVLYYSAAVLGGAIVGVLKPMATTLLGSMLLGFLVALPAGAAFLVTLVPRGEWTTTLPLATLLFAVALGPGAGAINWYYDRKYGGGASA